MQHDLPKKECVKGECHNCGITKYECQLINQNRIQMKRHNAVTWQQWEQVRINNKNGKPTYRTELRVKSGSIVNLLQLYMKQLAYMSLHQFFKVWQLRNFNLTINNLQPGQVLFVHDFQQNLLLITQDASSGSHWDNPQLTIHPTSVYYICSNCDELVKEDIIHITMDKNHDKHAVNQFIAKTIAHLREKNVTMSEIIEFTDHASSQYKSRFTFHYMTMLNVPCTHHYFGVKHGKGPSDRAGANFKRKIRSAVKSGKILLNSNAVEDYCKENFDRQTRCDEHDVSERDVNAKRNDPHSLFKVYNHRKIRRPNEDPHLRQLKGSRDYLNVVRNTGVRGVVEYRNFDCGCLSCTTHTNKCSQNQHADDWTKVDLVPRRRKTYLSSDSSGQWFKPFEIRKRPGNEQHMHFEEDVEETVHCDEVEEENRDVIEESEVEEENRDVIIEESEESEEENGDVIEEEEDHDVIKESEVQEKCDVIEESEVQEEKRDVIEESEVEEEKCDVIEQSEVEVEESDDSSVVELFTVPYESSEYSSDDDSPPEYAPEIHPLLTEDDENLTFNWNGILNDLKLYTTFNGLKNYVLRTKLPDVRPVIKYMVEEDDVVDSIAANCFPRDGPKGYIPIETMGDGNCGYRALAHVLLSDEGRHHEVRVRITFEGVMNEDSFLNHDVLARGVSVGSENRPAAYASYSGLLTPEITCLNEQSVRTVYHRDVIANARDCTHMGVWQLHHAAEAFRHPIVSVYPRYSNREVRRDINRVVLPINSVHDNKRPVNIMWTPLSKDDAHCNVKHFIALLVIFQ